VTHPAQRFRAPHSIQRGQPLKALLDAPLIELLGESFAAVHRGFARARFAAAATTGLAALELLPRAEHIARALAAELPAGPGEAAEVLIAALGPELTVTEGYGLAPFFYLPHVALIKHRLIDDCAAGMRANYAVTRCFSAEFSVRPYLLRYPEQTLALFTAWTGDPNPHVRRLVSEGSRPRLPWAGRLAPFQRDPTPTIALLERLKDDPCAYVRRSVANHVGDIAKDHPAIAFALCQRWLDEVGAAAAGEPRRAVVRHALRLPAQRGEPIALRLRRAAGGR
jgi:3-methyladenine DNA glycosylase AlkC